MTAQSILRAISIEQDQLFITHDNGNQSAMPSDPIQLSAALEQKAAELAAAISEYRVAAALITNLSVWAGQGITSDAELTTALSAVLGNKKVIVDFRINTVATVV